MPSLTFDSELPKPKSSRSLCYEGGTRVIALTEYRGEDLVLHSEILEKASPFFKAGARGEWAHDSKTVKDPTTGADVTILTYHLKLNQDDCTLMLSQEPPSSPTALGDKVFTNWINRFYLSENAAGFLPRARAESKVDPGSEVGESLGYLQYVQKNHREIFMLLHDETVEDLAWGEDAYHNIADKVAYAEFYQLLDLIGPALRELLLEITGLWRDVVENYFFHLALAQKLRCEEVFEDAMRHYIGNGVDLSPLVSKLGMDPAKAFQIAMRRDEQSKRIKALTSDLQTLCLATYVHPGHGDGDDNEPDALEVFKTKPTGFGNGFIQYENTTQAIACQIFSQWLSHHLAGDSYWLEKRQEEGMPPRRSKEIRSKTLNPGSLRRACNLAVGATQAGDEMMLFDPSVIDGAVKMSSLYSEGDSDAYDIIAIEKELKVLVNQAAALAMPLIAQPDFARTSVQGDTWIHWPLCHSAADNDVTYAMSPEWDDPPAASYRGRGGYRGRGRGGIRRAQSGRVKTPATAEQVIRFEHNFFNRYGTTAQNDRSLEYFTCTDIKIKEVLPWTSDFDKPYQISGLEPASAAWKKALGVSDNGEYDIEVWERAETSDDFPSL